MHKTLWSHDFTIITLGTFISAIGSTAMNFALSLVVFDQTSSTLLTGVFSAVSLIPTVIIPILAAPFIDSGNRKRYIYVLDFMSGGFYLAFAYFLFIHDFSYVAYLLFSLLTSSIGTIYSLAYSSLYPDLIPKGFAQKGYSVSSLIYPSVTALFTPIASLIYVYLGIAWICVMEGILLIVAAIFESQIHIQDRRKKSTFSFRSYRKNLIQGFWYLKKEKGIRSIYEYMAITNASAEGINLVSMAMFQSSPILSTTMYAFLTTADTIGRMIDGVLHYFIKIPTKKRYKVAVSVYTLYESFDMIWLFLPYPFMIVIRFIQGFLGINSLNIRESSTKMYIPNDMRARVDALFQVLIAFITIIARLFAGWIAQYISYPFCAVLFAGMAFFVLLLCIVHNKKEILPIYNQNI